MTKLIRDMVRPIPRVQSARPFRDLVRAFQSKPTLNAVLVVSGQVQLGIITRATLGHLILSRTDPATPLANLPKTRIYNLPIDTPTAQAALHVTRADGDVEVITVFDDGTPGHLHRDSLLRAVAFENAQRIKALKSLETSNLNFHKQDPLASPLLQALTHEIRTPLSGMMGLAEVLAERLTDNESRDLAQMIVESGQDLDRTLRNANEIVSSKTTRSSYNPVTTDLETLVDDLRESWALLAARQKTRFSIDLSPDGPPRIKCDQARVREMIDNLINNALRFTRSGDISITLSTQPIGNQATLSVAISQTGRRFSGAQKQAINTALATGALGGDVPGWALGLIVSQKAARSAGGTLNHADNPRGGSVITLSLPVENAEPRHKTDPSAPPMKSGKFDPGTVLVVEDHEASAFMTISALETAGWRTLHCHSLRDAAKIADREPLQAIVTDLNLMDGNGLSLIERVRHIDGINQVIPIISMTAEIGDEKSALALAAGADKALRKPVEGPALVAALADLIMQRETKTPSSTSTRLRARLVA